MKISTRFYLMMSGIILSTIILLTFTVISINNIRSISAENQNKNIPIMIHSLQLKTEVIQIQQWLTDISVTRAEPGLDDGFTEAQKYYENAKTNCSAGGIRD